MTDVIPDLPLHANLIRALRKQKHWTQQQLAEQIGVHRTTVARWETGVADPPLGYVRLFRMLLNAGQ